MVRLMTIIREIMDNVGEEYITNARALTPVRTGRMRDGWEMDQVDDTTIVITNDVPYAGIVYRNSPNAEGLRRLFDD